MSCFVIKATACALGCFSCQSNDECIGIEMMFGVPQMAIV